MKPQDSGSSTAKPDEERLLHQKMEAFRIQLASNKQASIEFLQRAGILTAAGKLAKPYRR